MRKSVFNTVLFVLFSVFVGISGYISAAELKLPEVIRPGDLFVVNLLPDQQADRQVRFKIDTTQLQFMGAQQGTPDIQIKGDAEFEIKPESGHLAARYDLLFQSLSSGSAVINYQDNRGEHNVTVEFKALDASRGYSWLVLAIGVVLLIVGIKLWRYQKSAPEMMSTKSLFMNYEELEKARKMYFPEESSGAAKSAPAPVSPEQVPAAPSVSTVQGQASSPSSPATVEVPKPSSGGSTSKQRAVKPVDVASRLAQFIDDDDDEPKSKPVKLPSSPAAQSAPVAAGVPSAAVPADSTLPASPAAAGDSTVPVIHTAPVAESTVPATPAVPASDEPPKAKIGMAPVEAQLRKDTGRKMIHLKLIFAIEDEQGRLYEAEAELIKIGRRKDCQIVLTASEISREHVEVYLDNGKIIVKPLTTSNICRLNGNELKKPTPIKPGDKLNMGGTEFLVTKARPS